MAQDAEFTATFGPYRIRKLLGAGRIASVFDAVAGEGADEERAVALKVFAGRVRGDVDLSPAGAQTHGVPGVRVPHPALVQLFEVGRVGDNLFLSMELVGGPSLAQLLAAAREGGHPLEPHVVATIAVQLAAGLGALHLAEADGSPLGSVHGDLRPSNVLLSHEGQPKITGWGVTNLVRAFSDMETPERPVEPPLYLSPEQTRDESATPASDVFSWGALVLELIVGKPVFDTPTLKGTIRKLRGVQLKAPLKAAHRAFPQLAPVVENALQKDPAARYQDGKELHDALRSVTPPATAQQILAQLIGEVRGDIPGEFDADDELMDRVSHLGEEESAPSVSSFVLPPSDPATGITYVGADTGSDPGEDESSRGHASTDELSATDEIGVTDEIKIAAATSSLVGEGDPPKDEVVTEAAAAASTVGDEDEDESGGEAETDDGEEEAAGPDATDTLPSDGVPAHKELDPDLEISAFNLPSTDDHFLETTIPSVPGSKEAAEARGAAAAAGRRTERVSQAAPPVASLSAKRSAEKVTVWTGTSGRPETVASAKPEEKPGAKWPWIVASVAAVILLGYLIVSELTPSGTSRDDGEHSGAGDSGGGAAAGAGAGGDARATGDAGTTGGGDSNTGRTDATPANGGADEGGETTTDAPLDPSILGPDPALPVEDEPLTPIPMEDGAAGAEDEPPVEMSIQHSPVTRGIRGRPISLSVAVDPPGSYRAVIWYRAAPGGPWQQTGATGGASGTLSGTIPHGAWLGVEADRVQYYIEVVGVAGTRTAGSASSPHEVKIY